MAFCREKLVSGLYVAAMGYSVLQPDAHSSVCAHGVEKLLRARYFGSYEAAEEGIVCGAVIIKNGVSLAGRAKRHL